ncbi:LAMI_0A04016g1_1 [Lachancea mirantina]|uniref:LAMI_0A04016g1_1 n=1 Tax=Lachancea mirantina TaxID=1230905 RepID=A0A1G4IP76_9SACH|nr:LAMI_0A04016g1_1 [Lachancea mirantina]
MSKKVLMLHGYAQSGTIFQSKTGAFRKHLKKLGFELFYPCAPSKIRMTDVRDTDDFATTYNTSATAIDIFGWWLRDANNQYKVPQETVDFLHDYIVENGPFDGIIGFSQGAGYAGYLCTDIRGLLGLSESQQPDPKFFITFNGFRMRPEWFQAQYEKRLLQVPSLHVLGELDTVVDESQVMRLYESCDPEKRTLLKHPGGHFVPSSKSFVTKVTNWLQVVYGDIAVEGSNADADENKSKNGSTTDAATEPQIDDDLMSIIDGFGKV